jgi:hypothetical protein
MGEGGWIRVWKDNFDWNDGVDTNKWEFEVGGHGWGSYLKYYDRDYFLMKYR